MPRLATADASLTSFSLFSSQAREFVLAQKATGDGSAFSSSQSRSQSNFGGSGKSGKSRVLDSVAEGVQSYADSTAMDSPNMELMSRRDMELMSRRDSAATTSSWNNRSQKPLPVLKAQRNVVVDEDGKMDGQGDKPPSTAP